MKRSFAETSPTETTGAKRPRAEAEDPFERVLAEGYRIRRNAEPGPLDLQDRYVMASLRTPVGTLEHDLVYVAPSTLGPCVGQGAFARVPIRKGQPICEYKGEVVVPTDPSAVDLGDYCSRYSFQVSYDEEEEEGGTARLLYIIDATNPFRSSIARYVNESRDTANARFVGVGLNDTVQRVYLVALRNIRKDEEILCESYGPEFWKPALGKYGDYGDWGWGPNPRVTPCLGRCAKGVELVREERGCWVALACPLPGDVHLSEPREALVRNLFLATQNYDIPALTLRLEQVGPLHRQDLVDEDIDHIEMNLLCHAVGRNMPMEVIRAILGRAGRGLAYALEAACIMGSIPYARALLAAGADPKGEMPDGRETPLTYAVGSLNPRRRLVQLLLEAGADVHARYDLALRLSAGCLGDTSIARLLLDWGADPFNAPPGEENTVDLLRKNRKNLGEHHVRVISGYIERLSP